MPIIGEENFHILLLVGVSLIVVLLSILAMTARDILDRLKFIDRGQFRFFSRLLRRIK